LTGDAAVHGQALKNGIELALEEHNRAASNKLAVIYEDGVALTPAGIEAAARLGHALSSRYKRIRLFHSPVLRCAQTAQSICEGAGPAGASATVHGPRNCLGGSYLLYPTAALPLADELRPKFVRTWFSGGLPPAIIKPFAQSLAEHTEYILAELGTSQAPASMDVHVTHDWNLMVLREGIFGIRYEEVGWPDYLDGVVLHEAAAARVGHRPFGRYSVLYLPFAVNLVIWTS
jgi:hypothetical protein